MSLMFGNYQDENVKPVLVDGQGRPLVVLDAVTGTYINVDVHSLPPIPAGSNLIGKVDINSQPAGVLAGMTSLPAGSNNIGDVDVLSVPVTEVKGSNNNKLFAYESQLLIKIDNTNLSAGVNYIDTAAVPAGKIWVITGLSARYDGTVTGVTCEIGINNTVGTYIFYFIPSFISGRYQTLQCNWVLKEGDKIRNVIIGATAGDDFYSRLNGYIMSIT